ncbi:transcription factor IBH1-like [Cornus florida]|uniref:transcription factor IBH1-like n=1 Tax=Cornus florida TaxID=4283 RepID=UPI002897CFA2|nr:transcription factor IBH1-like [Cornus florida]
MIPQQYSSFRPTSVKTRFTNRFLRALKRINEHQSSSCDLRDVFRKYRMIKVAADSSMASTVGSKKAWSRAMLWKIRCKARKRVPGRRSTKARVLRRRGHVEDKAGEKVGFGRVNELRKLVPGGETMDLERLLVETAHYVKCLDTQVQAMRDIVDFCST